MSCYWLPVDGIMDWSDVRVQIKSNGLPELSQPRMHIRKSFFILAGQDGNDMFGRESSNIRGAGIGSGNIGVSLAGFLVCCSAR